MEITARGQEHFHKLVFVNAETKAHVKGSEAKCKTIIPLLCLKINVVSMYLRNCPPTQSFLMTVTYYKEEQCPIEHSLLCSGKTANHFLSPRRTKSVILVSDCC